MPTRRADGVVRLYRRSIRTVSERGIWRLEGIIDLLKQGFPARQAIAPCESQLKSRVRHKLYEVGMAPEAAEAS